MSILLFYVSGHGFGHARRMVQVIDELKRRRPEFQIVVRSAAPARVFQPLTESSIESSEIDSGMAEADPLTIDREQTLQSLARFMERREEIVVHEAEQVKRIRPAIIVADIPFLSGDVARRSRVQCVGISNFTWDWIYEELFAGDARYAEFAERIGQSYSRFTRLLQLPFGHVLSGMNATPVPLIAPKRRMEPQAILALLGISPADRRPRILFGTRGGISPDALRVAAQQLPHALLLFAHALPPGMPANAIGTELSFSLDFSDLLGISNVVVSKLGYGIVSECVASRARLVFPRRTGFAEDRITESQMARYVPIQQISREDYASGQWGTSIRHVLSQRMPAERIATDGASICAGIIEKMIDNR